MEFKAPKSELVKLVARAVGSVDSKSTMPVLANVKVSAADGKVTVVATDLYISVVGETAAEVRTPGDACLPAKDFLERLRALPDGEVCVSVNDKNVAELKGSTARRFRLTGLPGELFPPDVVVDDGANGFTVESKVLASIINRTSYAISSDNSRAHLNSLQLVGANDSLAGNSTDGHRLASMSEKLPGAACDMLLSQRAVNELRRMLADGDSTVEVKLVGNTVVFKFGWGIFAAKQVDAAFPAIEAVIPKGYDTTAKVPRTALIEALKAVALAAAEKSGGVKLAFSAGTLALTTDSAEKGSGADEVPADFNGKPVTLGVNSKYLLDALTCLQTEEVTLSMGEALDPVLITSTECEGYRAVVMPMRL